MLDGLAYGCAIYGILIAIDFHIFLVIFVHVEVEYISWMFHQWRILAASAHNKILAVDTESFMHTHMRSLWNVAEI